MMICSIDILYQNAVPIYVVVGKLRKTSWYRTGTEYIEYICLPISPLADEHIPVHTSIGILFGLGELLTILLPAPLAAAAPLLLHLLAAVAGLLAAQPLRQDHHALDQLQHQRCQHLDVVRLAQPKT
jgi:hypothetical protein